MGNAIVGDIQFLGSMSVGTMSTSQTSKLLIQGDSEVTGLGTFYQIKINYNPQSGYILSSDSEGNASWSSIDSLNIATGFGTANYITKWNSNGTGIVDTSGFFQNNDSSLRMSPNYDDVSGDRYTLLLRHIHGGTSTNYRCLNIYPALISGNITNLYGIDISSPTVQTTVTNYVGIRIDNSYPLGSNYYGLIVTGDKMFNGFGRTSPRSLVEIASSGAGEALRLSSPNNFNAFDIYNENGTEDIAYKFPKYAGNTGSQLEIKSVSVSGTTYSIGLTWSAGYKKYIALLSQTSTSAPTATVLENTIGDIQYTYSATGSYGGTLSGAFTSSKKYILFGNNPQDVSASFNEIQVFGADFDDDGNQFNLFTGRVDATGNRDVYNDVLNETYLEIRIYY